MHDHTEVKRGEMCPTCHRYKDRNLSVDALIIKDEKILLIIRNAGQEVGKWALVGGVLDWDETVEEAVIREVQEEIGIQTTVQRVLGVYSSPDRCPDDKQTVAVALLLSAQDYKFKIDEHEVREVRWFSLDELPEAMAFDHRQIIEDYKKKRPS